MKRGIVIAFVGPDGSGKSTQAEQFRIAAERSGLRVRKVYGRVVPIFALPLIWGDRLVATILGRRTKARSAGGAALPRRDPQPLRGTARILFQAAYGLDTLCQGIVKFRLMRHGADILVTDRYVHDSLLTDFALHLGWDEAEVARRYERWTRLALPRPDMVVFLRVPADISLGRKDDIVFEQTYRRLVRLYHNTSFIDSAIALDGGRSIPEIAAEVRTAAAARLGLNLS